ncbi:helix-turn-helix domain-containing protein [Maridesulfovibrio ferrireducens]|uniref:helix-turn-helix domain-containing protein n=1 Tax=Maridesulfovibrio ferrireducens TaxID=246191 RepID=UPI001A1C0761|nr:helix-turn-helix transcriptional regulator [Maridesulfovibrio ferrireducens]MBI9113342.1 helix-turn-helix transcriptional regulator [Maridesulfovibrio ferrireducens]
MPKKSFANTSLSPKTISTLKILGENIKTARLRRNVTLAEMAERTFMTRNRLRKVERGDPTVGLGALAQVLEYLELSDQLLLIAKPETDELGKALEQRNRKKRASKKQLPDTDLDF